MFKNTYQDGKHFTLLSIQEKDSLKNWTISGGNLKKAFDKSVKGYVYITNENSKLITPGPKSNHKELFLTQTTLLFQMKILDKRSFSLEVTFTDTQRVKRRLLFSGATHYCYSKQNIAKAPLNARIPSSMLLEGVWLNLQFDLATFIQNCFDQVSFRSIDQIQVTGALLIRRIATYKHQIPDSFQFVIEKEFGSEYAQGFEQYV